MEEESPDYSALAALADAMEPDSQVASSPPLEAESSDCEVVDGSGDGAVVLTKIAKDEAQQKSDQISALLALVMHKMKAAQPLGEK